MKSFLKFFYPYRYPLAALLVAAVVGFGFLARNRTSTLAPAPASTLPVAETIKSSSGEELALAVTDANFAAEVQKSDKPVLVDFWATWCGPCRMYAPTVEKMAKDYQGKLKVVRVDVDQSPETARAHGIRVIPTTFLYRKGKVIKTWLGVRSQGELQQEVDKVLEPLKKAQASKP